MSSLHPITVVRNGVETRLDNHAYDIETKNGVHFIPGMVGASPAVPGRSGQIYVPGKRRGPGAIYLSMSVQETNTAGVAPADGYQGWKANLDALFKLFDTTMAQIAVREYTDVVPLGQTNLSTYNYIEALCSVEMAIAPEIQGRYFGRFTVECIINDGCWREKTEQTIIAGTAAGTLNLTGLAGSTAHIEDAIFCIDGPVTNPRLTDPSTGHYIQYTGTIANGTQWVIDCGLWKSVTGTGLDFNVAAGTNATALTTAVGLFSPRLYGISNADTPATTFSGSSMGANTRVRVKARRKFL